MTYDVVVIGSGPGGYVCAIKAAQLGLRVAVIERRETFGGTCLNIGCIPSKALLHASEMYAEARGSFGTLGVVVEPRLDLPAMLAHKDATVTANVSGVAYLFRKHQVDTFRGTGRFVTAGKVAVTADDGAVQEVEARHVVIATGSTVAGIPGVDVTFDEEVVVSSTGALSLARVPERMVVVGGGVIGLELGSVWARLGAKVTVVEFLDTILGGMDGEIVRQAQRLLARQGLEFRLGSRVTDVRREGNGGSVTLEPVQGGDAQTIEADVVLVATGRRPFVEGLGLEDAGVETDEHGRVRTDARLATNAPGIWAIGDVIAGPMLAHKAEDEGIAVAETIAGQAGHVDYDVIPSVVYTSPEIASVGRTEEQLKAAGVAYTVGRFPFSANGRARAMLHTDGFVKILADATSDRVLGVHVIGFGAGEMIHEAVVLMAFGGSAEDLARICHAHPTMSEAMREAALGAASKPIHI